MLSILIPTYNYDVEPLVKELQQQANNCDIEFEIIVLDDASSVKNYDVSSLISLNKVRLEVLNENVGRSAARNKLANLSFYEHLLFVDAGTFPHSNKFISNYLKVADSDVVIGGMINTPNKPQKPFILRWHYTKQRETCLKHNICTSANFLIKKSILLASPFDESIKSYGYEDVVFFKTLESKNIILKFLKNPVEHDCKEEAITFISKTQQGLENLKRLQIKRNDLLKDIKIIKAYKTTRTLYLDKIIALLFRISKPLLIKNLSSSKPSLLIFDFYKLGYFCNIKS